MGSGARQISNVQHDRVGQLAIADLDTDLVDRVQVLTALWRGVLQEAEHPGIGIDAEEVAIGSVRVICVQDRELQRVAIRVCRDELIR